MAFSVTIGSWVNENSQTLISKAVLELESTRYMTIMPGVKYKEAVKKIATTSPLYIASCGVPTLCGTTTLTDKDITVASFQTSEQLCPADLETISLQLSLRPGWSESVPFEAQYADLKVKDIQKQIEEKIWATTAAVTNGIDGLLYLIHNDSATSSGISFGWSGTTLTASEYLTAVYAMQNALPAEIQAFDNLTLFCGKEISRRMLQAFVIANLYHVDLTTQDINAAWYFPGTNIKVQPVNGLNTLNHVVLTPADNLIYATDMLNEEEQFKIWWSEDSQYVKFLARFKAGVSYYFSEYIVMSS